MGQKLMAEGHLKRLIFEEKREILADIWDYCLRNCH